MQIDTSGVLKRTIVDELRELRKNREYLCW